MIEVRVSSPVRKLALCLSVLLVAAADPAQGADALWDGLSFEGFAGSEQATLDAARVIETPEGWFRVVKLPDNVYGFSEPGHAEQVNSFLILGGERDLLYDTGMGIADIGDAIAHVRAVEGLPERELVVVVSHAHPDHIGGAGVFARVHVRDDDWTVDHLTRGLPEGVLVDYFAALTPPPAPPQAFDPKTHAIAPRLPRATVRLEPGSVLDLGGRTLEVMAANGHTSGDLVLFERQTGALFTGDAFTPIMFLVGDMQAFQQDVQLFTDLPVQRHFNTHGPLLIDLSWRARALAAVLRINAGEIAPTTFTVMGMDLPSYSNGDVQHIVDARALLAIIP